MLEPRPYQKKAVADVLTSLWSTAGQRTLLAMPTGGGKTLCAHLILSEFLRRDLKAAVYTNRRMLLEQLAAGFEDAGYGFGIRAAGHQTDSSAPLQISSFQSEHSRVMKREVVELHPADLVIVDEAHLQKGETAVAILNKHRESGCLVLGLTATPLDLAGHYDELIVGGTNSELRAAGALVPAIHFAPDEPDLKHVRTTEGEDLTEKENVNAIMRDGIFGRVLDAFNRINPERKPTLLFGPDVRGSLFFAEEFVKAGISAAHIDGEDVWINGDFYQSSPEAREKVREGSKDGSIVVVCNRFVMREGIDFPWLAHGIFATVFGSVQSYLQSGGRLLRAFPGLTRVTIQDHGGSWWRHGSLNEDRHWELGLTAKMVTGMRLDQIREKKRPEPFLCPDCSCVVMGRKCPCGREFAKLKKSRVVVQSDGTLKQMNGDILRPRRLYTRPNGPAIWERMYWRSRTDKGERTFRAAAALFAMENHWGWPNPQWPLMPTDRRDWFSLISEVPMDRLRAKPCSNDPLADPAALPFSGSETTTLNP